ILLPPSPAADGHSSTHAVSRGGGGAAGPRRQATDPGALGGPPTDAPLFGLAPCGVCRAAPVTRDTGGLLPHRFTLAGQEVAPPIPAVCSLWHFPSRRQDWVLPSAMPCGVRTFLSPERSGQRPSVPLRPGRMLAERSGTAQAARAPRRSMLGYGSAPAESPWPATSRSRRRFRRASRPSAPFS